MRIQGLLGLAVCIPLFFTACESVTPTGPEPALEVSADFNGPKTRPLRARGWGSVGSGAGERQFEFRVRTKRNGEVRGSYKITLPASGLFFSVDVSCMTVEDKTAWIAGHITDTNASFVEVGSVSYFYAIDNRRGRKGEPDVISIARFNDIEGEDELFCRDRPLGLAASPIDRGRIRIR